MNGREVEAEPKKMCTSTRPATAKDLEAITNIYNHFVANSHVTLQEEPSDTKAISAKWQSIHTKGLPYTVLDDNDTGTVCGFAYADTFNERSGYCFTVETSVYLHPERTGRGMAKPMLLGIIERLRKSGKKQVMAKMSILPEQSAEDVPSCRLHVKLGFREVGRFRKVGFKFDEWIDVVVFQLDLDNIPVVL